MSATEETTEYVLDPPSGFVRIVHPDLPGQWADVPEGALYIHKARGWVIQPAPKAAPKPAHPAPSKKTKPTPDAEASDTKEP